MTNESYQLYLDNMEVCEICNNHASDLRTVAENRDVFKMLKEDLPRPPKFKKEFKFFKEKLIISIIALCCLALAIQHVVLTLNAAYNGIEEMFYSGWQKEDAVICMLLMVTLVADYFCLLQVRRNERRVGYGV